MYDEKHVAELKAMNLTVYEEIYQIRIELVSGCNLNCEFCGVSSKKMVKMTKETMQAILNGLTDRVRRIEFALHGEPSLHPHLETFISMTRSAYPKAQILMISNMERYRQENAFYTVFNLFNAGLNCLQSNMYNERQYAWMTQEVSRLSQDIHEQGIQLKTYKDDFSVMYTYKGPKERFLLLADRREAFPDKSWHKQPHNWGGNLPMVGQKIYPTLPMSSPCVEPLKYAAVTAEGNLLLCCTDGSHTTNFGNVNETNLTELWQSDKLQLIRALLKAGHRHLFIPCILCNSRSVRSGLYPYWGRDFNSMNVDIIQVIEDVLYEKVHLQKNTYLVENLKQFLTEYPSRVKFIENKLKELEKMNGTE